MSGNVRARLKKSNRIVRERRLTYKIAAPSRSESKLVTRRQINTVVRKIVDKFDPEKIILFGSYAYGKPNIDSDVDMLVIMESDERPAVRTTRVISAAHGKTFPMDLLVRTPAEVEHRLAIGDFLFQEILGMGKVLYDRRNT